MLNILRQPVAISVTVFSNKTKLTNDHFIFFISTMEGSLANNIDLPALYLRETYCHKTGTRPPSLTTNYLYQNSYKGLKLGEFIPKD